MSAICPTALGMATFTPKPDLAAWTRKAVQHFGGNQAALADRLASVLPRNFDRSTVNKMTLGKRAVAGDELLAISSITGYPLPGAGPALQAVEDEAEAEPEARLVPVYDVQAAAGAGMVVDEYEVIASRLAFPPGYMRHITTTSPENLAIISVTGGSMTPTLHHDDIVMVDMTKKNISYDGMFVIRLDGLLKVKRLRWEPGKRAIRLISDNAIQHPEEVHTADDVEIVGRVIWVGAKQP